MRVGVDVGFTIADGVGDVYVAHAKVIEPCGGLTIAWLNRGIRKPHDEAYQQRIWRRTLIRRSLRYHCSSARATSVAHRHLELRGEGT